ncbi:MFS transporter [Streptosporangium lutulentum]|uniref:MFS family permease n=1 Tax=Streptosporangium lutulentum TaxID=1461250 RepID=A0ABT9Q5M8_9ACTN|nr:MFS transporter [Streptosporangium lutulentum]MDP9841254.1 MFS family permease [Streptosporangium lutulentum]
MTSTVTAQRRTLAVLSATQISSGIGVAVGLSLSSLVVARLSGSTAISGLAGTATVLGTALLALPTARTSGGSGRRAGLTLAYGCALIGTLIAVLAISLASWPLLLGGLVLFGGASAGNLASRYSATDLSPPGHAARHLSWVVWAGTIGSVAGPNLAEPAEHLGRELGLAPDTGPFVLALLTFAVALLIVGIALRPDPLLLARSAALTAPPSPTPPPDASPAVPPTASPAVSPAVQDSASPLATPAGTPAATPPLTAHATAAPVSGAPSLATPSPAVPSPATPSPDAPVPAVPASIAKREGTLRTAWRALRDTPVARRALVAIAVSHTAMVSVMSMTPVHLDHGGATYTIIGVVISLHIAGMYIFSPVVGWLADRIGRIQVMTLGMGLLLAAAVLAGGAGPHDVAQVTAGLALLGVGWSCGLISGSAMISEAVPLRHRPAVQGLSDLVMNVCGATGTVLAGVIVGNLSYGVLGAAVAVMVTITGVWLAATGMRPAARRA